MPIIEEFDEPVSKVRKARVYKEPVDYGLYPEGFYDTDVPIVEMLYEQAQNFNEGIYLPKREKSFAHDKIHPSSIGKCAREQFYKLREDIRSKPISSRPEWVVSAKVGTAVHTIVLENWLKATPIFYSAEGAVSSDIVEGHYDAEVIWNKEIYILDLKTVKRSEFDKGAYAEKVPVYVSQLTLYAALRRRSKAIILLFCRESGRFKAFEFKVTAEMKEDILIRAYNIKKAATDNILPRAEDWGKFTCRMFCEFYNTCIEHGESGIEV